MSSNDSDRTAIAVARIGPRRLAEAITAPGSLLLAGAAAGLAVAAAGPVGLGAGVVVWLGSTLFRLRPKSAAPTKPVRIDPFTLGEPWRQYVQSAEQARVRFQAAVAHTPAGALRDNLAAIGTRVDDAATELWGVANRAFRLERSLTTLNPASVRAELADAQRELDRNSDPARIPVLESTVRSLEAQLASNERLTGSVISAQDRLRELDAQLDELVARGVELSVSATTTDDFSELRVDVDNVATQMEALRQAFEETNRLDRGATA